MSSGLLMDDRTAHEERIIFGAAERSYNQNLWMRDLNRGAAYLPS